VWRAWTEAERLRAWWGPNKTTITDCEVDLRVGGRIYIVMEATKEMGKYKGTRWPMEGTFVHVDERQRLVYDARSWTEGEEGGTITHTNDVSLVGDDETTVVTLQVSITEIGRGLKAKLAVFGMKWGYKSQLDALEKHLAG
jgi:uncharacterized protein YndB with AHSA1/START domain